MEYLTKTGTVVYDCNILISYNNIVISNITFNIFNNRITYYY